MVRHFLLYFVLISLAMNFSPATAQPVVEDIVTVQVTGEGATRSEARLDAIRQAMQYATEQLVIAERLIESDQVLIDRVYSTMNGFVENFHIVNENSVDSRYQMLADVSVSRKRIVKFVQTSPGFVEVDGMSIFAEKQRQEEQLAVQGEMLASMFRRFPEDALQVDVKFDVVRDQAQLNFNITWDNAFISGVENFIKEIAFLRCRSVTLLGGKPIIEFEDRDGHGLCESRDYDIDTAKRLVWGMPEDKLSYALLGGYFYFFGPINKPIPSYNGECNRIYVESGNDNPLFQLIVYSNGSDKNFVFPLIGLELSDVNYHISPPIRELLINHNVDVKYTVPLDLIADDKTTGISAAVLMNGQTSWSDASVNCEKILQNSKDWRGIGQ